MAARRRGPPRIPSGGEAGLSVEPQAVAHAERVAPLRIVAAGGIAAAFVLFIDQVFEAPGRHLGPVRVLTTLIEDAFHRAIPLEGLLVIALHFSICVAYAGVVAHVVARMLSRQAVVVGAISGALLYLWHFYGLAPVAPWLADGRDVLNFTTHTIFGVVVAILVRSPRLEARS